MKRESGSFGHAQVRAFGAILGTPFSPPYEILLRRFGHRVKGRTLHRRQSGGFGDSTLLQDDLFGHSYRQLWGFRAFYAAFSITTKQAFVVPRNDMFLIMSLQCVPEEIDLPRRLSPSSCCMPKPSWGLLVGVVHQRPLGASRIPSTQNYPLMNPRKNHTTSITDPLQGRDS